MWGDDFHKKFQILKTFFFRFYYILLNIKRHRNIQGFALVRAVLFKLFETILKPETNSETEFKIALKIVNIHLGII